MNQKLKLATEVLNSQKVANNKLDIIFKAMWQNITSDGGFRLTSFGFKALSELGYKANVIELTDNKHTGSILLGLDRYLKVPYYIKGKKISIFDEQFSLQLILYGGDLRTFISANED